MKKKIEIYKKQNGVIMRNLIKEYNDIIEEVKWYIQSGWEKLEAINFVLFDEFNFKFTNNENDRVLLNEWMNTKMRQLC